MSVDSLLKYARSQIGYVETPTNRTKYGQQMGNNGVFWCMQFVWACFENSANPGLVPKTASTRDLYNRARKKELGMQWLPGNAVPRPGDLAEFDMGGPEPVNHVGIVEQVTADHVICIEGNTGGKGPNGDRNGGMVARKKRSRRQVVNYVRPKLTGQPTARPASPPWPGIIFKEGSKGDHVKRIQARLNTIYRGNIPGGDGKPFRVNGVYGQKTKAAVTDFQRRNRLRVDGEVGKFTWKALFG